MERTNREQEREQAEEWEQEQALLRAAQAGDSPALSRLLDRYLPLLQAAAAQPHLRTIREDALAEGYVSFVRGVRAGARLRRRAHALSPGVSPLGARGHGR